MESLLHYVWRFHQLEIRKEKERLVGERKRRKKRLVVDGQWLTFPFPFVHHQAYLVPGLMGGKYTKRE